jgi:hypothetical protein
MQRLLAGRMSLRRRKVRHAITDLYDEERRTFLIQYPVWLILVLGVIGVIAFAITGFMGYGDKLHPTATYFPFGDPIVLLPWFYALQITLLVSIFRHPSLRWRRYVIVGVTLLSIVVLGVAYNYSFELRAYLNQLLHHTPTPQPSNGLLTQLTDSAWTYTIINFGILLIFWLDTVRRWVRRAQGLSPNPEVDLGLDDSGKRRNKELPRMEDVVSGDLIAGAVLSFALAGLFLPGIIAFLRQEPTSACVVALPGPCGADVTSLALSTIDTIMAFVTLPLGLIILALSAMLSGLGAVGGVEAAPAPRAAVHADGSARKAVSEEVSLTVLKTLQSALDRRIRIALVALAVALRNIVWPILILISVMALAISAELIEAYLHDTPKTDLGAILTAAGAGILGIVAALFTVFAAALFIFSRRVASNSLKFLGLVGFVVLLTFWLFSLALSLFNVLLNSTGVTGVTPFWPPAATTVISFLALVLYGAIALRRLLRQPQGAPAGAEAMAADADTNPEMRAVQSGSDVNAGTRE